MANKKYHYSQLIADVSPSDKRAIKAKAKAYHLPVGVLLGYYQHKIPFPLVVYPDSEQYQKMNVAQDYIGDRINAVDKELSNIAFIFGYGDYLLAKAERDGDDKAERQAMANYRKGFGYAIKSRLFQSLGKQVADCNDKFKVFQKFYRQCVLTDRARRRRELRKGSVKE